MNQDQKEFHDYIMEDVLSDVEGVTSKAMFGGYGLYQDGFIFGMIIDAKLYFKVDEQNQPDYQRKDSKPFVYEAHGQKMEMKYWQVPDDVLEDRDEIAKWLDKAVAASKRAKKAKKKYVVE